MSFLINYSAAPDTSIFKKFDTVILDPDCSVNLSKLSHKNSFYGYLSVGEVSRDASYYSRFAALNTQLVAVNKVWNSDVVALNPEPWQNFVINDLAKNIVDKNYDGFFLDTCDSYLMLPQDQWKNEGLGLVNIIRKLKEKYPYKKIITNRGFPIFDLIKKEIEGVLVEGLYQNHDGSKFVNQSKEGTEWLFGQLKQVTENKKKVYILDYVNPNNKELGQSTGKKIEKNFGFQGLIYGNTNLDGKNILYPIEVKEVKKKKKWWEILFGG